MTRVSIITAFLNEENTLPALRERLEAVLREREEDYEIVLVDDHSTDASRRFAADWAAQDPGVTCIRLSHTCGSHAAFSAGLASCRGDCAILLAADLQDPPETIPRLLEKWRSGHHVVWAVRSSRAGESWTTKLFARAYYGLMRLVALPDMPSQGADFLLVDRKVIDAYNAIPEKNTSFLAMILWIGFQQTSIEYVKSARHAGKSKWTLAKKLKLLADSLVSFSYAPIRAMTVLGAAMASLGLLFAVAVGIGHLAGWRMPEAGFTILATILLVGQGLLLVMLGVLGEYVWRAYDEIRGRPRYIIESRVGSSEAREGNRQ